MMNWFNCIYMCLYKQHLHKLFFFYFFLLVHTCITLSFINQNKDRKTIFPAFIDHFFFKNVLYYNFTFQPWIVILFLKFVYLYFKPPWFKNLWFGQGRSRVTEPVSRCCLGSSENLKIQVLNSYKRTVFLYIHVPCAWEPNSHENYWNFYCGMNNLRYQKNFIYRCPFVCGTVSSTHSCLAWAALYTIQSAMSSSI